MLKMQTQTIVETEAETLEELLDQAVNGSRITLFRGDFNSYSVGRMGLFIANDTTVIYSIKDGKMVEAYRSSRGDIDAFLAGKTKLFVQHGETIYAIDGTQQEVEVFHGDFDDCWSTDGDELFFYRDDTIYHVCNGAEVEVCNLDAYSGAYWSGGADGVYVEDENTIRHVDPVGNNNEVYRGEFVEFDVYEGHLYVECGDNFCLVEDGLITEQTPINDFWDGCMGPHGFYGVPRKDEDTIVLLVVK